MKKVLQVFSAALISLSFAGTAAAATPCSIYETGTNSNNICETNLKNENFATCDNNIVVSNENSQIAETGQALLDNNTSGGSSTSGDANNSNVVIVTIGASCGPVVATVTPTPTPTPTATVTAAPVTTTPQVKATPKGGVGAGAGSNAATVALAGLTGSAALVGIGTLARKFSL